MLYSSKEVQLPSDCTMLALSECNAKALLALIRLLVARIPGLHGGKPEGVLAHGPSVGPCNRDLPQPPQSIGCGSYYNGLPQQQCCTMMLDSYSVAAMAAVGFCSQPV